MGEFPLALPETGPTVAYGWWDFIPGASPRFVNRATGAAIRYVGELDPARVPEGEGEWRLFEYSDPDFSYPLVVRWRSTPRKFRYEDDFNFTNITLDYRLSSQFLSGDKDQLQRNFGAYVRIDDACQSVFSYWPFDRPLKGFGLALLGGWVGGQWRKNIRRRLALLSVEHSNAGNTDLDDRQQRQGGLYPHPLLAPFSMVSQRWHSRSKPMENTPEDLKHCLEQNPHNWSGLQSIEIEEGRLIPSIVRMEPLFMQSSDARSVMVLTKHSPLAWSKMSARFACCLLKDGLVCNFTARPRVIGLTSSYPHVAAGFHWLGNQLLPWPYNRDASLVSDRGIQQHRERAGGSDADYILIPTSALVETHHGLGIGRIVNPPAFVPCPDLEQSLSRLISDAMWNSPSNFFPRNQGLPNSRFSHASSDNFILPYDAAEAVRCGGAWLCGVYNNFGGEVRAISSSEGDYVDR